MIKWGFLTRSVLDDETFKEAAQPIQGPTAL